MFHDIPERGIRRGECRGDLSTDALARHFVMAIRGISYEWCIRYPDLDLKAQAEEHVRLLLEGVCAPTD